MNTFYEIFVNKVKELFDNHEEAYQPADWDKLQSKMGKKRSGLIILLPYIAKAAIIIIFLGLSVFILNNYENDIQYLETAQYYKTDNQPHLQAKQKRNLIKDNHKSLNNSNNQFKKYKNNRSSSHIVVNNKATTNKNIENVDKEHIMLRNQSVEPIDKHQRYNDFRLQSEYNLPNIEQIRTSRLHPQKPILKEIGKDEKTDENKQKRLGFGLEIASLSSYSDMGVDNDVNIGAGISASYKLSKNFSLSTGMLIAKQSLAGSVNYGRDNSSNNLRQEQLALSKNNVAKDVIDNKSVYGFQNLKNVSNVSLTEQKREFLTLDIPLNVVYKYKKISFTTGVSSLLHLKENQDYKYQMLVNNSVYNSKTQQYDNYSNTTTVNTKEYIATNHFDFAQLLNFSVGYGIEMRKGSIIVEPYIKVPIGTLSSQDIFMGAGGVVLRYNFFK